MRRRNHKLKPNKTVQTPHNLLFFDTETFRTLITDDKFQHTLRLGQACYIQLPSESKSYKEEWLLFKTNQEFYNFIMSHLKKKTKLYIFAHNMHFDFQVIDGFEFLRKYGFETKKWFITSNRVLIEARSDKGTLSFIDTSNFSGIVKLKTIGESMGLEKMDQDPLNATDEELIPYCKRDVEIIKVFILNLISFIKDNELCSFGKTVATLAFNTYRHKFMKYPIYIHTNPEVIALERNSYRGGRCEAFFIGNVPESPIYYLDINSMYPYVMKNYNYPNALKQYKKHPTLRSLLYNLKRYDIIARVQIHISKPAIALKGERLIFPTGTFWVTLTSPELKYVMKQGEILDVSEYATYTNAPLFEEYVDWFYEARMNFKASNNKVNELFTKLMLNSLYGRFGMKINEYTKTNIELPPGLNYHRIINRDTKQTHILMKIGNETFISNGFIEGYDTFVPIPSFITAYARMYLWELIKLAGPKNVFYCDTDSIFVSEQGYNNVSSLISTHKDLGKLSIKKKGLNLTIKGAKMYQLDDEIKIKGVTKPKSFDKSFSKLNFSKLRSSLMYNHKEGVQEQTLTKRLSYKYQKGIINNDGWVTPFNLNQQAYTGID